MQSFESMTPGAMMAPVGQASMHLVQLPQTLAGWEGSGCQRVLRAGAVGVRSRVVITSDKNSQEPNCSLMRQAFLPMMPRPDCSARARSRMGPVST